MYIKEAHEHKHQRNQTEYSFRAHVAFGTCLLLLVRCGLAQLTKSLPEALRQAGSHFVQGVDSADEHAANCYGTANAPPTGTRNGRPIIGSASGKHALTARAEPQ